MGRNPRPRRSDWFDAYRRQPRWVDARMVRAQLGGAEYMGITRDVSLNGMRLALVGASPNNEETVLVLVAFEKELIEVCGIVAHTSPRPWGCLVGIECGEIDERVKGVLCRRYLSSAQDFQYTQ